MVIPFVSAATQRIALKSLSHAGCCPKAATRRYRPWIRRITTTGGLCLVLRLLDQQLGGLRQLRVAQRI